MKDVYLEKNTYVKLKFRRKGAITKVLSLDKNLVKSTSGWNSRTCDRLQVRGHDHTMFPALIFTKQDINY